MMVEYIENKDYDKVWKSSEYSCLRYFSKKALKAKYPKGGNITIGAIGEGVSDIAGTFVVAGNQHDYFNLHYAKFRYGIDGYIECGQDQYIAVIKNHTLQSILKTLCVIVLLASLLLGSVLLIQNNSGLDSNAVDYTPPNGMKENTDPNNISIPGYGNIKMLEGSDDLNIALWNPSKNPCYFKFHLILSDTKEEIYTSELVAPGKAVTNQKLTKKMKQGIYSMTIKIDSYSLDDKDIRLNGGAIATKLIVLSKR